MAVTAAVPVFPAVGVDAWGQVQELRARRELRLVDSPRHAAVLLVAGTIAAEDAEALDRAHDQLPHPRTTVAWEADAARSPPATVVVTGGADDLVAAVVDAHRRLQADAGATEPDRLPDEEPNEWRGVGPHGQGGEGMMGGTPYGRPMAMTGDDLRDGVALDRLSVRLGPFLPSLPPGLVLDLELQGELVQALRFVPRPTPGSATGTALATDRPGTTEAAVARTELRWLSHALHVHGLDGLAVRTARLAIDHQDAGAPRRFSVLQRRLRWSGIRWSLRGVGQLDGIGDAATRWQARLDRIAAALAGEQVEQTPPVTSDQLEAGLVGSTLGAVVTTLSVVVETRSPRPRVAR